MLFGALVLVVSLSLWALLARFLGNVLCQTGFDQWLTGTALSKHRWLSWLWLPINLAISVAPFCVAFRFYCWWLGPYDRRSQLFPSNRKA